MCLAVVKKFKTKKEAVEFSKKPLIAKRNIVVYKLLKGTTKGFKSPFKKVAYETGVNYKVNKFSFGLVKFQKYGCWVLVVNQGIHTFATSECAKRFKREKELDFMGIVGKCVIPKGTKYFKNDTQFVSLKLGVPLYEVWKESEKVLRHSKEWEWIF